MGRIRRVGSAALSILLALAAGAGFGWLAKSLGSALDPFLLAAIFSAVVGLLELGAGIRHLLTGVAKDLLEMEKLRLETEKLRLDIARAQARLREPSGDEVIEFGAGEPNLDRYKRWERRETPM